MPNSSTPTVIVIGAGVVGCSIAYHLVRSGARVTVFDKGGICAGMSARSGALIRMHYTFAPEARLAWDSLDYFANWRARVGVGDCNFVRTGFAVVVGEENAARLEANVAMLRGLGVDTTMIDCDALRRIDPAVTLDKIAAAAYEPQSGYADPIATTQSFADAATQHGARFQLHREVTAITLRGDRATGVEAVSQRFDAHVVCIVAGPWSDALLAPAGVRIGLRSERAQVAFFRRDPATRHLAYIDTITGCYFRPHSDDLTLGGLGEWRAEAPPDPDRFVETNDPEFIPEVRRRIAHRIPAMADAPYSRGHAGIYDVSPDSRAVIDAVPGVRGLFVAAGFSGTGFKTSPAVGAAMAKLILEGKGAAGELTPFSFGRILSGSLIRPANEYTMGAGFGHTL
jgi:sarcosine oxidase subunit beta